MELNKPAYLADVALWREWNVNNVISVKNKTQGFRLMAMYHNHGPWKAPKDRAYCSTEHDLPDKSGKYVAALNCGCGFYGFYTLDELIKQAASSLGKAFGFFYGSGHAVHAELGMRTEFAEPRLIILNDQSFLIENKRDQKRVDQCLAGLRADYKCPVIVSNFSNFSALVDNGEVYSYFKDQIPNGYPIGPIHKADDSWFSMPVPASELSVSAEVSTFPDTIPQDWTN